MNQIEIGLNTQNKIYYIGDLPNHRVDGIILSFKINIDHLGTWFDVIHIPEYSYLDSTVFQKLREFFQLLSRMLTTIGFSPNSVSDVAYFNYSLSLLGSFKSLAIVILCKLKNLKIVLHIHRGDFYINYFNKWYNRLIARLIMNNTDTVIVISQSLKRELIKDFPHTKIRILSNTTEKEVLPKQNFGRTNFIFISNYLLSKGIFDLLEVFSELSQNNRRINLSCYGSFSDELTQRRIEKYKSENISINEGVYGNNKFDRLKSADCLILPSHTEGVPLVILEAMSVGLPVIASKVGYIPEMLGEDYPYIVKPINKEDLKSKINQFISDTNADALAMDLLKRYNSTYSRKQHFKKLDLIFEEIHQE